MVDAHQAEYFTRLKNYYNQLKERLGQRPTRVQIFLNMLEGEYLGIPVSARGNPFKDHLSFIAQLGDVSIKETSMFADRHDISEHTKTRERKAHGTKLQRRTEKFKSIYSRFYQRAIPLL